MAVFNGAHFRSGISGINLEGFETGELNFLLKKHIRESQFIYDWGRNDFFIKQ
jgi:hypothetical protein